MGFFKKDRKYVPKRYRKKRVVKKIGRRARNTIFRKKVMKVLHSQVETKQAYTAIPYTTFNSGINSQAECLKIIPNISKGSNDNGRIGDQIKPLSLQVRGIMQFLPQGATVGDGPRKIAVRIMCVTPKAFPTYSSAYANATTWQAYLLKKGSTATGFTGIMSDIYAPVNTDAITCHYNKVHYMTQSGYYAVGGATSGLVPSQMDTLVRFVNKTFRFGSSRTIKYDDNIDGGLTPANFGAYIWLIGYTILDGADVPDTATVRVSFQADCTLNYEDA